MFKKKHCAVGITSFIISTLSGMGFFMIRLFRLVIFPQMGFDGIIRLDTMIIFVLLLSLALSLIALGLGISGILKNDCKKIFPLLGIIVSSSFILIVTALLINIAFAIKL